MTMQEFKKLKVGTKVGWREVPGSPLAENFGIVTLSALNPAAYVGSNRLHIQWPDGQTTEAFDVSALTHVEVIP